MLHIWLIPALVFLFLVLLGFYLLVKFRGGPGVRTDGRTLFDKPDENPPED